MLKRCSLIAAALGFAALFAVPVAAQPTQFSYATGKIIQGAPVAPGDWTPLPNQLHIRNAVGGWYFVGAAGPAALFLPFESEPREGMRSDPGPATFATNCNLDANMQGECWGTVEMTVGGGGWVGTWSGKFDLGRLIAQFKLTARGTGEFSGRNLKMDGMGPAIDADFYFLAEVLTTR